MAVKPLTYPVGHTTQACRAYHHPAQTQPTQIW